MIRQRDLLVRSGSVAPGETQVAVRVRECVNRKMTTMVKTKKMFQRRSSAVFKISWAQVSGGKTH